MLPDLSSVLLNWTESTQMKVINKAVVDFQVQETAKNVLTFEAMLTVSSPQKIARKPEGQREWMWWDMLTTQKLNLNDLVQDPENRIFEVNARRDWGKAGFYAYDLIEKPVEISADA